MYKLIKQMSISGAHSLNLDYESKCKNLHGHNWDISVYLKSEVLDSNGMIMDFTKIKEKIQILDHANINDVLGDMNPTAENIAFWICQEIGEKCYKVEVSETSGNMAIYER